MIINCFYGDFTDNPDIIYVPNCFDNLEIIQEDFFQWVFDEDKSNATFINISGMKVCQFDTGNFVFWINEYLLAGKTEKACIVSKNTSKWSKDNKALFF